MLHASWHWTAHMVRCDIDAASGRRMILYSESSAKVSQEASDPQHRTS